MTRRGLAAAGAGELAGGKRGSMAAGEAVDGGDEKRGRRWRLQGSQASDMAGRKRGGGSAIEGGGSEKCGRRWMLQGSRAVDVAAPTPAATPAPAPFLCSRSLLFGVALPTC